MFCSVLRASTFFCVQTHAQMGHDWHERVATTLGKSTRGHGRDQKRSKHQLGDPMSGIRLEERVSATRRWINALLGLSLLLVAQPGEAADGIKFFKNYFVTGDYVAGSVDLLPQQAS